MNPAEICHFVEKNSSVICRCEKEMNLPNFAFDWTLPDRNPWKQPVIGRHAEKNSATEKYSAISFEFVNSLKVNKRHVKAIYWDLMKLIHFNRYFDENSSSYPRIPYYFYGFRIYRRLDGNNLVANKTAIRNSDWFMPTNFTAPDLWVLIPWRNKAMGFGKKL